MGNYTIFRCLKILGEAGRQARKFYNKCSENSRSLIVFRTDIFRELTLGAPKKLLPNLSGKEVRKFSEFYINTRVSLLAIYILILHCDIHVIRFTGINIIVVRPPSCGANYSQNCRKCSFCCLVSQAFSVNSLR